MLCDLGMETVKPFRCAHDATSEEWAERVAAAVGTSTADATAVKSSLYEVMRGAVWG